MSRQIISPPRCIYMTGKTYDLRVAREIYVRSYCFTADLVFVCVFALYHLSNNISVKKRDENELSETQH